MSDATPGAPIPEPGFPACQCRDCRNPTQANIDTRLVHRDRHEEFRARYQKPVTDTERGMWTAVRMLDSLTSTEPVGRGQCVRPDHQMLPAHPAHPVNPYGTCDRAACYGKPAHAAHS